MEAIPFTECSDCNVNPITLLPENITTEKLLGEEKQLWVYMQMFYITVD